MACCYCRVSIKMKTRNLEYERKFRKYLFSFDLKTHLEICENINVEHKKTK